MLPVQTHMSSTPDSFIHSPQAFSSEARIKPTWPENNMLRCGFKTTWPGGEWWKTISSTGQCHFLSHAYFIVCTKFEMGCDKLKDALELWLTLAPLLAHWAIVYSDLFPNVFIPNKDNPFQRGVRMVSASEVRIIWGPWVLHMAVVVQSVGTKKVSTPPHTYQEM